MNEAIVFAVLALSLVLFVVGKWRYDIVAILALLVLAILGIVVMSLIALTPPMFNLPELLAVIVSISYGLRSVGAMGYVMPLRSPGSYTGIWGFPVSANF